MRMTANERKELDEWVEKEYPKSEKRLEGSSPFHQLGKFLIGTGILSYIIFALSDISFLKPVAILFLILGMIIESIALIKYFRLLSHED
ncbi:MAG: hypothetical protein HOF97_01395 [Candidatus Marinimicrobia bacterium]|jgi:hypothetical protein|nr:hypothetical protein [Candidatus Neomarinimicrobiota bacterium]MBT4784540.1 hypothetical protein [Candidatus Neomarinimicrobiota bacterium]MBT5440341.1 hypothetical protein [Candidatus Neomarinimicrobiota bacterium]MBT7423897.1 hypothetical protein [Candidatus Neomarinimicrobiota bacterium]MDG2366616.1 hypothetical protein [Candidatus Neomarinimicrobiota bacterium]|tara:strand:+ start:1474 stop:1740 length:267 start_codon:yes stop_codon:yes gene_type:complete